MTLRVQWRSKLKPIGWALFALLATTFVVSALVSPSSRLLPGWHSEELSCVLPARINPPTTFAANTELAGKIANVLVSAGSQVTAGQTLAVLESDELNDEIDRARRRVKFVESRIAVLQSRGGRRGRHAQTEQYDNAVRGRKAARERLSGYSVA